MLPHCEPKVRTDESGTKSSNIVDDLQTQCYLELKKYPVTPK